MTVPAELIQRARQQGRTALDEQSGKALLSAYGIAVPRSVMVPGAGEVDNGALNTLKAPYAVKVVSPDILHKSDAGGVVRVRSAEAVRAAVGGKDVVTVDLEA